jgi:hypothetical protein
MRRVSFAGLVARFTACALGLGALSSAAQAAPSGWNDLAQSLRRPRDGELVFEHLPTRGGGLASDTDFLDLYGNPNWQQLADDVMLGTTAAISRISLWAFYDLDNPPPSEVLRLRFYVPRAGDGLPGDILYGESFINPSRIATGHHVYVGVDPHEYLYDVSLAIPFTLAANTLYWLEFVQIGDQGTAFRWENAYTAPLDTVALRNVYYPNWAFSASRRNTAFQLWAIPEPTALGLFWCVVFFAERRRSR